jgi:hypothetical protein
MDILTEALQQAGKVAPVPAGNEATVRKIAAGEFCQSKQ